MKRSSEIRLHHGSLWTAAIDTPRESIEYIRADMEGYWDKSCRGFLWGKPGTGGCEEIEESSDVSKLRTGTAEAAVPTWIEVIINKKPHFWQLRPEVGHPFLLIADS